MQVHPLRLSPVERLPPQHGLPLARRPERRPPPGPRRGPWDRHHKRLGHDPVHGGVEVRSAGLVDEGLSDGVDGGGSQGGDGALQCLIFRVCLMKIPQYFTNKDNFDSVS